ncbi:MAG: nitrilase family protein, partial [Rhodothermales bacterium]
MHDLRAASVQFQHAPGGIGANLARVTAFVEEASGRGVDLIAFPEMCLTGYWHVRRLGREEVDALAEPVPDGTCTETLLELADEHEMTIGAGLIERDADGTLYNSYIVAMPAGRFACHRKLHAFISEHITSGDSFTVFDLPNGTKGGILTCYDNNLIENARITALMGAEVLLAPHQTGGCHSRSPRAMGRIDPAIWHDRAENPDALRREFLGPKGRDWILRWLPSRAHDNGMYLLFANGVGLDDDEVRTGNAMILDPYGQIVAESRSIADDMVVADLKADDLPMSSGRRWLKARRPELYAPLTESTGSENANR